MNNTTKSPDPNPLGKPRQAPAVVETNLRTDSKPSNATGKNICGLIMPISAIDTCSEAHWAEVREIIEEAAELEGLSVQLVSEADDVGVIQKRIIHNLYENKIVICDVSGKNPNVMFELGMRLAFDKPTIIIKDDKTSYSFDTAPIEHLEYPRDLRFSKIVEFKDKLRSKMRGTIEASEKPGHTTFLKNFGTFKVAKLDTEEVSKEDLIIEELKSLRGIVSNIPQQRLTAPPPPPPRISPADPRPTLCLRSCSHQTMLEIRSEFERLSLPIPSTLRKVGPDHFHLPVNDLSVEQRDQILKAAKLKCSIARIL